MSRRNRRQKIEGQFFPITRGMRLSEAWKCLSPRAVYLYTELMGKYKGDDDEELSLTYGEVKGKMGRKQFYIARKELVKNGFFDVTDPGGKCHKKTKFKVSISWKSISIILKEEKDREAQSKRAKTRNEEKGIDEQSSDEEIFNGLFASE